jgi:hypothetical protein
MLSVRRQAIQSPASYIRNEMGAGLIQHVGPDRAGGIEYRKQLTQPLIAHPGRQTDTVNVSSLRVTARYIVSRSNGSRPASVISRTRSARRIPCGVVAPASW